MRVGPSIHEEIRRAGIEGVALVLSPEGDIIEIRGAVTAHASEGEGLVFEGEDDNLARKLRKVLDDHDPKRVPFLPLSRMGFEYVLSRIGLDSNKAAALIDVSKLSEKEKAREKAAIRAGDLFKRDGVLWELAKEKASITDKDIDAAWREAEALEGSRVS